MHPNGPNSDFLSLLANDATLYNAGVVPGLDNDFTATSKVLEHRRKRSQRIDPRIVIVLAFWGLGFIVTGLFALLAQGLAGEGHGEFWFLGIPFWGYVGITGLVTLRRFMK